MKLAIRSVRSKGDIKKECVWLDVNDDIDDLHHYAICDTTYDDGHVSNELRHIYWFTTKAVKKNDRIKLVTKPGRDRAVTTRNKTTHVFHWRLGKTVWNKSGDTAVLLEIDEWKATRVPRRLSTRLTPRPVRRRA
jgi:hypothetical protein